MAVAWKTFHGNHKTLVNELTKSKLQMVLGAGKNVSICNSREFLSLCSAVFILTFVDKLDGTPHIWQLEEGQVARRFLFCIFSLSLSIRELQWSCLTQNEKGWHGLVIIANSGMKKQRWYCTDTWSLNRNVSLLALTATKQQQKHNGMNHVDPWVDE